MSAFGVLLKRSRQQSRDLQSGRPLTQERLAELLSLAAGIEGYSGSTVSNWERGLNQIRRDDRHILVALIAVLHQTGGLQTQDQANQFLLAGNYRPLDKEELAQIEPNWTYPQTSRLGDPLSAAEQEALLPIPTYSRLFGVETLIQKVIEQLKSPYPRFIVLTGRGGLGKSAVANAVARRAIHQHLFAHVIWVSAAKDDLRVSSETLNESVINALCQQLLPEDTLDSHLAKRLIRLRFKLQDTPHLIIIDNLEESDEALTLLRQLQGMMGSGKCLLTARHYLPPEMEATTLSLPELSLEDATALLNYQAEVTGVATFQQAREKDIENLYDAVGGHPLALRLIPRLAHMYPLSEIVSGWQNVRPGRIADVYKTVYDELWQSLLPPEKQLMAIMPLMATGGGTLAYLQAICGLPQEVIWPVLTRLMECCLIEAQGNLYEQRYGIHRLTEQYVFNRWRTELPGDFPPIELIQTALAFWQQYLDQLADKELYLLDKELDNLARVLHFSLTMPVGEEPPPLHTTWQNLFEHLFRYSEQRGHTAIWLLLLEKATDKFAGQLGLQSHLLNRLGELHRLNHQIQAAIRIHHRVLQQVQQAEETVGIAQAHLNLGNDYLLDRQYENAIEHGLLALAQFEQLGLSGRERAATLNLMGTAVRRQGHLDRASHYLQEAASIWRHLKYRPELARTLRNLAAVLQAQRDIDGAGKCYDEANKVLAKTASELDRTLIYLAEGTFHFEQKRYHQADAVFKRIDLAYLRKSGHIYYLAYALNNIGNVAFVREHYAEAEQLLRDGIRHWQHLAEPLEMANSLGRLGDVLMAQAKRDEARLVFMKAADLLERYDRDGHRAHLKEEVLAALVQMEDKKREG